MHDRAIFNEDHRRFRDMVRRFLTAEYLPFAEEWESDGLIPRSFYRKCGEYGLLCPSVPEAYGGAGGDFLYNAVVSEESAYTGYMSLGFGVHSDIAPFYLLAYATEEQKHAWLPKMVSGELLAGIAMSEPGTGSDLQAIKTRARRDGDWFVIDGAKTFISNGQNGDLFIVVCRTSDEPRARGVSLIVVEGDRTGLKRGRNLAKLGQKGADTSELFLENVRVPVENLLGEAGQGFAYLMRELPRERTAVCFGSLAASQKAFEITVDYVKQRQAFGQAVFQFQNTRFKLAELKTELSVGWAYLDACLERLSQQRLGPDEAAMAKLWVTEMHGRVVDVCLQLHGGYGYMSEYPISRMYADARVARIYGGTSEIMKEIIARHL